MKEKLNIKYSWVFFAAATFFCSVLLVFVLSVSVNAANSSYSYYFTVTNYAGTAKYDCVVSSDNPIVVTSNITSSSDLSEHFYEFNRGASFVFYTLDATGNNLTTVQPSVLRSYTYTDGEWVLNNDYESTGTLGSLTRNSRAFSDYGYGVGYYNFAGSGLDILKINITDKTPRIVDGNVVGIDIDNHSLEANIASYLINKKFVNVPLDRNFVLTKYSTADKLTPSFAYSYYGTSFVNTSSFSVLNAQIDEDGVLSFEDFVVNEEDVKFKGVIAYFYDPVNQQYYVYDKILSSSYMYQLNLGGVQLATVVDGALEYKNYTSIVLQPYYVSNDDILYSGDRTYLTLDSSAEYYNRTDIYVLENIRKTASSSDKGVTPEDGDLEGGDFETENDRGTYDEHCYFVGFDYIFTNDGKSVNLYALWSDVKTSYKYVSSSVKIYVCAEDRGGYYLFNDDDYFFSSGSIKLNYLEVIAFLNEKLGREQIPLDTGVFIRFVPEYYTGDATYHGKVIDLEFRDGKAYIIQLEGSYVDGAYDSTDLTPPDYYEDNSVIGGFLDDVLNPPEDDDYNIDVLTLDFFSLIKGLVNTCGQFPALVNRVFSFLPDIYVQMLVVSLGLIVLMRILGR